MPAGFACGGICDAILIIVYTGACGGGGGGGINVLTLTYLCGSKPIIYCTCTGYYMESSWKFLLGI